MTESDVELFIAWSFLEMGNLPLALEHATRGVDKAIDSANMDCVCYGFACLGFGNLQAGNLAQAQEAFDEALRRSRFSGARQVENLAASGLAMTQVIGGKTEALDALVRAYDTAQAVGNQFGGALVAQALGQIFLSNGDAARAAFYLDAAIDYFARTGLRPYLERTRSTRARLDGVPNELAPLRTGA
jgi:hypothetical protein